MIRSDGHTHPNLLKKPHQAHDFITRAVELKFDEIVFTDHMPFTVTGDEHDRIPFGAVGEYLRAVREISSQYSDKIAVKTGIELDFHPMSVCELEEVLDEGSFDRVLASSHLNIKGFGVPFGSITRSEYAALVIENYIKAAEWGRFDVLTHLDVYRWVFTEGTAYPLGDDGYTVKTHEKLFRHLFALLEKKGIALEFNTSPFFKGFSDEGAYPSREILKIAEDYRLRYVYGSDAHKADHVGYAYDEFVKAGLAV